VIGIVDYGMGNILSVFHAFESLGADVRICRDPDTLVKAERIVVPGVGAFGECMRNLRARGFDEALQEAVRARGKPVLGICLGMQIMAARGFEGGTFEGLGWFDGDVIRLTPQDPLFRVPHVGWNNISFDDRCPLFKGLEQDLDFYFVHSYALSCNDQSDVSARCDYGAEFTAAVWRNNIFATQFHPEKSQDYGLKILDNFMNWKP
jgi:imidazole glycerol-phosphate synthase subunit HisH